jgi:hypothetical protein
MPPDLRSILARLADAERALEEGARREPEADWRRMMLAIGRVLRGLRVTARYQASAPILERMAKELHIESGPVADARMMKSDPMETFYERLIDGVGKLRASHLEMAPEQSKEQLVDTLVFSVLGALHYDAVDVKVPSLLEDPEGFDALRRKILPKLQTPAKQDSDESIVNACLRAVDITRPLGSRKRQKDYRANAKKRAVRASKKTKK